MSLIMPDDPAAVVSDQPRLHAFIIGVADYPHLQGGAGAKAHDQLMLSQVTTPRHSAIRMLKWLLEEYRHPEKPLGSIELVLSPDVEVTTLEGIKSTPERANCNNIEKAFNRWKERCSKHRDNIALFYFCGHGVQKGDQFLLAEDFGDPSIGNAWRNCINFTATMTGMKSCKAQTQLFFVDACRETPFGMLESVSVNGQVLASATVSDYVSCSAAYYATTEGKQAYGPPDGETYFCKAIIACLNGLAATNQKGRWVVTAGSLSKSISEVMEHYAEKYSEPLDCNPDVNGRGIICEPGVAKVIASIGCSSPDATAAAEIELRRGGVSHKAAKSDKKPLVLEVEPGDWEAVISFPSGEFAGPTTVRCVLMPAVFEGVNVP